MNVNVDEFPLDATQPSTEKQRHSGRDLRDLVNRYALPQDLPSAEWLLKLNLERPREDVRSLDECTRFFKRTLDIVVSATMLILLAPVMLAVAFAVWATSPGPVIFQQTRTGLNLRKKRKDRRTHDIYIPMSGQERRTGDRRNESAYGMPFTLYKFRTMRTDAEKDGAKFATRGDPRVTCIGGFLRKSRLDELPQLWNVLRGDMTLVGPRPERPEFIQSLSRDVPGYLDRLGLRPGLTGLAQVLNGYDNDIDGFRRKVALDLLYLQNCCIWNDLKILVRTAGVVVTGKGAL